MYEYTLQCTIVHVLYILYIYKYKFTNTNTEKNYLNQKRLPFDIWLI